jgi:hypothetical protein
MTRARKHELGHVTDEDIRMELQRRLGEEVPTRTFVDDFANLPPGAWGRPENADELNKPEMRAAWTTIARLALARIRELLEIPIDPNDPNYGFTLRGINSAISSGLTFIARINAEILRPKREDVMPKIIAMMEEERQRLEEDLLQELIKLDDKQIDQLMQLHREKRAAPSVLDRLLEVDDNRIEGVLQRRRQRREGR